MNYTWKIIKIGDIEKVGQNALDKRTVVLEEHTDKDYKWWVAIDFIKDKVHLIDDYKVWDIINVSINIKCNEHNWKHYNSINGWKIEWLEIQGDEDDLEWLPF